MLKIDLVKNAMLAVQRYPWEQGVCAQALWKLGNDGGVSDDACVGRESKRKCRKMK